ncbi:MAG: winged helix-turn-helix transcriptional regulator [Chloroflexi bacterium]|nr:MAG: winged helix-turn-helix transcriptional regulator [Chloroflexota bacterium]
MSTSSEPHLADTDRDLILLEHLEQNPDATQASLAAQLGVAVGTINWHIKRLIAKGYIKARRVERRKLRYIITPEGLALRARLTLDFIKSSFRLYRLVRERSINALLQVEKAGYSDIFIEGEGDVADICRLTCLEKGLNIADEKDHAPVLHIQGLKVFVELEETR